MIPLSDKLLMLHLPEKKIDSLVFTASLMIRREGCTVWNYVLHDPKWVPMMPNLYNLLRKLQ